MLPGACPDESELAGFIERAAGVDRVAIEAHLDTCAACRETIALVAATTDEPRQIGRYRLDRVVGSGGMGEVWQAWDPALERSVAIKVLRPELTSELGGARLVREARVLARLQHPNVIAVYDVGELDGEVFIATELVDGESLEHWQLGRPPAEVIAAYVQAARGLAAAHALGLVHRDVKPSNVLVSRDGRVRVGDFGLAVPDVGTATTGMAATSSSESRLTDHGTVVGTPAYMSPEQRAAAQVDARADQFSLCLALAEALIGERPEPGASAARLAASGIAAPWPAIARGLAKRPADRYPSLAPLIAELAGERRRSRVWLVAAAGAGVAIAAVAAVLLLRADPAAACADRDVLAGAWRPDAIRDAFRATKLPYAEDSANAVIRAVDTWASELAIEDRRACEDAATQRQSEEVAKKRRSCLDRARAQMVELVAGLVTAPDASTIQRAPASARALSSPAACNTEAGLADQIVAPDPAAAARIDALSARVTKARTLRRLGKLPDARAEAEHVLADARASSFLPVIAEAQLELGTILHQLGEAEAERTLEDALAVAAQAHADHRAASISALLVEVVGAKGDVAAADRQARLARPAIIRAGNDKHLEAVVERGLGRAHHVAAKFAVAFEHYKRAEEIHAALGLGDDVDFDLRAQVTALGSLDRFDEATRINQRVLASDLANLGPKHPSTLADIRSGAVLLYRQGRFAEAAAALEKMLPLQAELTGDESPQVAAIRARIAAGYLMLGRLAEAETMLRECVRVLAGKVPADDKELRGQRMNLANVLILRGRYGDAELELGLLVEAARAAKDDESLGAALQNLAEVLTRDGQHAEALVVGRESVAVNAKLFGPVSRRGAESHGTLGNVHMGLGKLAEAAAEYERAIHGFATIVGKETPQLGEPLTGLGEIHLARKQFVQARPLFERAIAVLAKGDPIDRARAKFGLARALEALRDHAAARAAALAALELYNGVGDRAEAQRAVVERWLGAHP